jgi:hypothetical protein
VAEDTELRLFWFTGSDAQYLVRAESMDDAGQQMKSRRLRYTNCGPVYGPDDNMPRGVWVSLEDLDNDTATRS